MNWKSLSWKMISLIIAASLIFLWLIKAPAMSWYLSDQIKVPILVRRISIWPSVTTIHKFRVSNPRTFKDKAALEAKQATIHYRLGPLFSNPCEIDQIEIEDIFLSIDCSNPLCSENNWTAIGDGMAKKVEKKGNKRGRKVVVHKLILSNLNVEVRGLGVGQPPQKKQIARLEFDEIDSEKGFPTEKLIRAIFQGAGFDQFIKNAFNPQNAIKQFFPRLFSDAVQEAGE